MIYRAPERTTPARGRAVTHELAALLVGMAVLAALILQFACAGVGPGGPTGRWLCVNNARLAALRGATPTPTGTPPIGRAGGIRPVSSTPTVASLAPFAPTVIDPLTLPGDRDDAFAALPTATDSGALDGYPDAGGAPRAFPTPGVPLSNVFDDRRATRTAMAAEGLAEATARALADEALGTASATATPSLAAGSSTPTPTPGPGTPSVTPGPSPSGSAEPTQTGYP